MKKMFFLLAAALLVVAVAQTYNLVPDVNLRRIIPSLPSRESPLNLAPGKQSVVYEESVVTKVVEDSLPSVVTVGITKTASEGTYEFNPFDPFGGFRRTPGTPRQIEQNIGSGFIVSEDGLIITNKHVVSDTEASYRVFTNDEKEYTVERIYRDPLNDLAILKVNAGGLKSLPLGDSDNVKLGQMAIAIGTPLGEFTNTVTTGIISGLGRGITAGSAYEGFVEKLDNVIQTDAAISAGNSGGPLLNSRGEVVGINTAIAQEGQNIGFAIPSKVVSQLLSDFDKRGGSFERPYLGVSYQMIDRRTAVMNSLPEGAYVESVVEGSPAQRAGIQADDIITELNGQRITAAENEDLVKRIADLKIGDQVRVKLWRNGETVEVTATVEGQ